MSEYENFNDPDIYKKEDSVDLSIGGVISNFLKLLHTYHILFSKNIATKNPKYRNLITRLITVFPLIIASCEQKSIWFAERTQTQERCFSMGRRVPNTAQAHEKMTGIQA